MDVNYSTYYAKISKALRFAKDDRVKYRERDLLSALPDMMGRATKHRAVYEDISRMGVEKDKLLMAREFCLWLSML